jgi:ketosteroid isomerase-like protein
LNEARPQNVSRDNRIVSENLDAFLVALDATRRGDWETFVDLMDPEGELFAQRSPVQGTYVGPEGVARFAADTRETFDVFHAEYPDIRDLDDRVLAIGTIRVRGRGSQLETEIPSAVLVTYRNGLVYRFRDYGEAAKALEAAGLSE